MAEGGEGGRRVGGGGVLMIMILFHSTRPLPHPLLFPPPTPRRPPAAHLGLS
jgi:hypothetical protein